MISLIYPRHSSIQVPLFLGAVCLVWSVVTRWCSLVTGGAPGWSVLCYLALAALGFRYVQLLVTRPLRLAPVAGAKRYAVASLLLVPCPAPSDLWTSCLGSRRPLVSLCRVLVATMSRDPLAIRAQQRLPLAATRNWMTLLACITISVQLRPTALWRLPLPPLTSARCFRSRSPAGSSKLTSYPTRTHGEIRVQRGPSMCTSLRARGS